MTFFIDINALIKVIREFLSNFIKPMDDSNTSHQSIPDVKDPNEVEEPSTQGVTAEMNLPLKGVKITFDAGHGGTDPGAVGPGGTREADINLAISKKAAKLASDLGATIIQTRTDNVKVSLADRVAFANNSKSNIFVSIHCNASNSSVVQGMEVYHHGRSKVGPLLAKAISDDITTRIDWRKNNGVKSDYLIYPDSGFYVLRETSMPAILLEADYISNPYMEQQLNNDNLQGLFAEAIVYGIMKHLGRDNK